MSISFPKQGFVFWPVGTGDSTTIFVAEEIIVQVDLHHLSKADGEEEPHTPIVDKLVELLPQKNNKPYLSVFVLTHPDKDHIKGFKKLLDEVEIGEIWHSPRIFSEYKKDLCDDAQHFKDEANRRRKAIQANPTSIKAGDRLRVIGHDELFSTDDYKDFPEECRSFPGTSISILDDQECKDIFEAFVHAPFKEDLSGERNDTSLAFQIQLSNKNSTCSALLLGDISHPILRKIIDKTKEKTNEKYLGWNLMLAPHHCSKSLMFWKDDGEEEESFKREIMADLETYAENTTYIIASCESNFTDEKGKNPPHMKARKKYEEIVSAGCFLCTHEHPNKENPELIVFELSDSDGIKYHKPPGSSGSELVNAISKARGSNSPPQVQVGFGKWN